MSALLKYDAACRAIAEAKAVDEAKDLRDKAEAMRVYGRQAKNRDLEIDAAEIRMRAERRLGEMLDEQERTVGLNRGSLRRGTETEPRDERPTLAEVGIDKKLSARARKMAAVPAVTFERLIAGWRENVRAENERVTVDLLRHGQEEQQREARRTLARELSDASVKLTGRRKYPCVYADPAWRLKSGIGNRSYENHYPTMTWDEIMALPVRDMLLPDAWLFIWLPRAHLMALHEVATDVAMGGGEIVRAKVRLPLAWAIAQAWGCDDYSTLFVWTKTDDEHPGDVGMGFVVRDQDEILCLFKRGRGLPKPKSDEKFGSNHRERSKPLGHSRKPEHYRRMIASMTGGMPVLEMFARVDADHPLPKGWDSWGNEAASEDNSDLPSQIDGAGGAAARSDPESTHPTAATDNANAHGRTASFAAAAAELPAAAANSPDDDPLDIPAFLLRRGDDDVERENVSPITGIGGPR